MKKHASGRSELLLIEIIMAILFFSIASAVCLQIFVRSHALSEETGVLNMAVTQSSSVAAILNQSASLDDIQDLYPQADISGDTATIYYNKDFTPCTSADAAYCLNVSSVKEDDHTVRFTLDVSRQKDSESVYQIDVLTYVHNTL